MKLTCEVIRDLLPLYYDGVASAESKQAVEEHLAECGACRVELAKIGDRTLDDTIKGERDGVVARHAKAEKRKSLAVGAAIAGVLAIPVLVCLIVNLVTGHALDWFFIVLTSLMTLASLTVVPLVVTEERLLWTLGSFTASLLLLLLTSCIYSGGGWFLVAAIPVVFGLCVCFLPYVAYRLPLKGFAARNKGLLVMAVDTALLFAVVIAGVVYASSPGAPSALWTGLKLTLVPLLLPWGLFLVLRYARANALTRAGIAVIYGGVFLCLIDSVIDWILDGSFELSLWGAGLRTGQDAVDRVVSILSLAAGLAVGIGLIIAGRRRGAGGRQGA